MNSKLGLYFRVLAIACAVALNACQHQRVWDSRTSNVPFDGRGQTGYASWYGDQFNGKKTASGEIYDMYAMTAAHRTAPFGTKVRVTNLDNNQQIVVTINDRGPFVRGRIIDLSKKGATDIGMMGTGTAKVRLEFFDRNANPPVVTSAAMRSTPESPASPRAPEPTSKPFTETTISAPPTAVTANPPPPAPSPVVAGPSTSSIYIQIASFESKNNASMYVFDFQRTMPGITARIYNENGLYRIRTGPYATEEAAQDDLAKLKKANFSCFVLHPK